jgi:DNA-directed RNA polymerase subunit RPC12/RpoP
VIRFNCKNCGQGIKVNDQYAGKKGKCPRCGGPIVVPAAAQQSQEQLMKFRCPHCSQKIGLPAEYAGKQVRCAKCKQPFRVPRPSATPEQKAPAGPPSIWDQLGGMEELRLAGSRTPAEEETLKFQEPPARGVSDAERLTAYGDPSRGLEARQEPEGIRPSNVNVGFFIGLGCAAAIILAMILMGNFLFGFISSVTEQVESPEAQAVAENFIYMLEEGKITAAKELLTNDLRANTEDAKLESFAKRMTAGKMLKLKRVQAEEVTKADAEGLLYWYDLEFADGYTNVLISILKAEGGMQIDGAAAMDISGNTEAIGLKSYEQLVVDTTSTLAMETFKSTNFSFPCIAFVILGVVGIIQIAAVWTIFDKAGQPGWAILIPFYNMWVWALVADKPGWLGLLIYPAAMIPYMGWLVQLGLWIVITIGVAKTFNRGIGFGLGLCFLPVVFYPILAFGND